MLTALLILATVVTACTALVRRARRTGGYQVPADPYEAADDATDDHDAPAEQTAEVLQASVRPTMTVAARPRPLPRRLRRVPIQFPPHVDPPMTAEQLAHVRDQWPHMVSAYFRDSAER